MRGRVFVCPWLLWLAREDSFKNLQWNIGYWTLWTRHYLSRTNTSYVEKCTYCTKSLFWYVIFFCGNKFVRILWICVPRILFSGQKSDAIHIVVLKLGVRVVLFSSEGDKVSGTDASPDYNPEPPLICEPLGVLIVKKMLYLRGCFTTSQIPHTLCSMIGMGDC